MSQHDYNIANQTFSATRTDLNNALGAVATNNAGNSAPSTTYANQWWFDSDGNTLYMRNKDNDAWVTVLTIGATSDDVESLTANVIAEGTSATGVTVDGMLIKDGGFTATLGSTITTADNSNTLTLVSTDADANPGPVLNYYRNSGSAADNDYIGRNIFTFNNDATEVETALAQNIIMTDVSNGSEDVKYVHEQMTAGSVVERFTLSASEAVFNEGSVDVDFRVESDNSTHALFVQGSSGKVGMGESSPLCSNGGLHIKSGDSGQGTANGHADELVIEGSANSGINILSGASGYGNVFFGDSGDSNAGEITYNHSSNYMAFATSGTERFRISSDGLAIGGTGAANSLDDYEEGTFAYAINGSNSGNLVLRSGYARGEYVKIGNLVYIDLRFETTSDNSIDGNLQWTLPFTKANANASDAGNSTTVGYIRDNSLGTNYRTGVYIVGQSEAYAQLLFSREGAANSTVELANDGNTDGVMEGNISIAYRTT